MRARRFFSPLLVLVLLSVATPNLVADSDIKKHMTPTVFLKLAFADEAYEKKLFIIDKDTSAELKAILRHPYKGKRIKYWQSKNKSAWIIEEKGKDLPITFGFMVSDEGLQLMRVLVYREPQGGMIYRDFYTQQFIGAKLTEATLLDRDIDGISGATISVASSKRIARVVLLLHDKVFNKDKTKAKG